MCHQPQSSGQYRHDDFFPGGERSLCLYPENNFSLAVSVIRYTMNNTNESLSRQQIPLLAPKLSLPRLPADVVEREALLARLDGGLERKLTLLCAPAGFGKTTLAGQWLARLSRREQRTPAGSVALGKGGNEPLALLGHCDFACL